MWSGNIMAPWLWIIFIIFFWALSMQDIYVKSTQCSAIYECTISLKGFWLSKSDNLKFWFSSLLSGIMWWLLKMQKENPHNVQSSVNVQSSLWALERILYVKEWQPKVLIFPHHKISGIMQWLLKMQSENLLRWSLVSFDFPY